MAPAEREPEVDHPGEAVFYRAMPLDRHISALEQVPRMTVEHSPEAWSGPLAGLPARSPAQREVATLLLAVNYELSGYPPPQAWMFADREMAGLPDPLDG